MRMTSTRPQRLMISILCVTGLAFTAAAQDTLYQLVELEGDDSGSTKAYALNNTGQVVGWVEVDGNRHAAHWHVEVYTDLNGVVHFELEHPYPYYTEDYAEAYDISDADQVVGTAHTVIKCDEEVLVTNSFMLRPVVLTDLGTPYPGDALTNLGTLGLACGAWDSAAIGISNRNHVVGWADTINGVIHAYLVTPVGGQFYVDDEPNDGGILGDTVNDLLIDLGTLPPSTGDPVSSATAVNDAGQVTGYSYTVTGDGKAAYHAYLVDPIDTDADDLGDVWFQGGADLVNTLMTDLGTLGGTNSWGRDINNDGTVVGESDVDEGVSQHYTRAFQYVDGIMTDLGTLGGNFSSAAAVNDSGAIVGWAENDDRNRHAFIYADGEMQDLNDLICTVNENGQVIQPNITLTEARDINEDGLIVGWAVRSGGTRGFLLIPIDADECPEATSGQTTTGDNNDNDTTGGDTGSTTDGTPIVGTPGNLSGGSDDTDPNAGGDAAIVPQCGFGVAGLLPLMVAGLCVGRQLRRR